MEKTISIITPTFNSGKTVERTILSVVKQYCDNLEYIIVDGNSSDNTLEIAEKYHDYISKIVSEPDSGIADAFNKGISLANGEIIGIINSDDELLAGTIARVLNTYDGKSDILSGAIIAKGKRGYQIQQPDRNLENLRYKMTLPHPGVYIRKSAYQNYGNYDLQYKIAMDRELLLRMYLKGASFQFTDDCYALFNCGEGVSTIDPRNRFAEDEAISVKYGFPKSKAALYTRKKRMSECVTRGISAIITKLNLWNQIEKYRDSRQEEMLSQYIFDYDDR